MNTFDVTKSNTWSNYFEVESNSCVESAFSNPQNFLKIENGIDMKHAHQRTHHQIFNEWKCLCENFYGMKIDSQILSPSIEISWKDTEKFHSNEMISIFSPIRMKDEWDEK